MALSDATTTTAGILLLSIVAVQSGGVYLLRIVGGGESVTPFQQAFARAGHAHAAVLVVLGLVVQPYADAASLSGLTALVARSGVPAAAILMPAGFFFSSMGAGRTEPNRFVSLVWVGAASLAIGVVTLGVGLLTS